MILKIDTNFGTTVTFLQEKKISMSNRVNFANYTDGMKLLTMQGKNVGGMEKILLP